MNGSINDPPAASGPFRVGTPPACPPPRTLPRRLWKAGIVRENYSHADVGGVIIVFELDSVEEAKRYVADFPLSRAGMLEWEYIAFGAPLPLEFLFDSTVDVAEPYDRTPRG